MEDFNEAMFKTKVDNIFVKLYTCIMKGDLTDVRHFISEELYNNYINNDKEEEEPRSLFKKFMNKLF
jgi:hypothetical protein